MRLVLIEWVDSFGCSPSWEKLSEFQESEPMVCRSVGWLLVDGKDVKVVVPHLTGDHDVSETQGCGDMTIPTVCIRRIVDLSEPSAPIPL